ncbi:hypothetical protein GCM10009715_00040 [Paeniglutamicibacter psychrophenolicus]|uniref:Uncharacterized protein n=1 Tax=Paeniglutamicibacter psychrophenolicus TaxID=257454 RepID=A0ABS4WIP3_9MICC|nr:hypothetical protein [Paeniglutamicibacter psychrophenolicus]MBP2376077.1 hypothetical protein [Paeniglutamicibacter psychrophenolicus]
MASEISTQNFGLASGPGKQFFTIAPALQGTELSIRHNLFCVVVDLYRYRSYAKDAERGVAGTEPERE